jgi:hypothetical protein
LLFQFILLSLRKRNTSYPTKFGSSDVGPALYLAHALIDLPNLLSGQLGDEAETDTKSAVAA